jgi:hypothetical protein
MNVDDASISIVRQTMYQKILREPNCENAAFTQSLLLIPPTIVVLHRIITFGFPINYDPWR